MFDYVTSDPQMRELIRIREDGLHDYISDVNSAERKGIEEGIAIGKEEGIEEGIAIGEERGIAIGKEEGITEGKRETALNLLSMGLTVEQISQATNLSIKEIESLM
jgi:predicted transposase/invertase (TIGR01784 family)